MIDLLFNYFEKNRNSFQPGWESRGGKGRNRISYVDGFRYNVDGFLRWMLLLIVEA